MSAATFSIGAAASACGCRLSGDPGIPEFAIAEEVDPGQAEMLGGALQFRLAQIPDRRVASHPIRRDRSDLAAGGAQEMHLDAARGVQRQRTPRAEAFIIRVGQHRQQRKACGIAHRLLLLSRDLARRCGRRTRRRLLAEDLHHDGPAARAHIEVDEDDLLPGPQTQLTVDHGQRKRRTQQRRPDMGVSVSVAPTQVMPVIEILTGARRSNV